VIPPFQIEVSSNETKEAAGLTKSKIDVYKNDVWAAGILLVNMISGKNPWRYVADDEAVSIWDSSVRRLRQKRLKSLVPALSDELCKVLADVFTAQDKRLSAADFRRKIQDVTNFSTWHATSMAVRDDSVNGNDPMTQGYSCSFHGGSGNRTDSAMSFRSLH
jgi:serine/threonine protein kinase